MAGQRAQQRREQPRDQAEDAGLGLKRWELTNRHRAG